VSDIKLFRLSDNQVTELAGCRTLSGDPRFRALRSILVAGQDPKPARGQPVAVPDYQTLMLPILERAATGEINNKSAVEAATATFGLTPVMITRGTLAVRLGVKPASFGLFEPSVRLTGPT
jgi:hypothetical protein